MTLEEIRGRQDASANLQRRGERLYPNDLAKQSDYKEGYDDAQATILRVGQQVARGKEVGYGDMEKEM